MKNLSKLLCILFTLVLVMYLFSACGSQPAEDKNTEVQDKTQQEAQQASTSNTEKITLRFSWWGGDARHKATLDAIDVYMQKNPNVTIEAEYGGVDSYREKLVTQLASGSAADIIQDDVTWLPDHIAQGEVYANLYDYKDMIDLSGFDETFLTNSCVINGRLQALPTGINGMTLILNKDFLEKNAIDYESDWTWERILEEGKQLHKKDSNLYLINADLNVIVDYILVQYVHQITGNDWINEDYTIGFDKAALTEGFNYIKALFDNGVVEPISQSILFNGKKEQNPKWTKNEFAMTLDWSSLYGASRSTAPGELTVGRFPYNKDGVVKNIPARPAQLLCINDKSQYKTEAAKFLNFFFYDEDCILALGDSRGTPAVEKSKQILVNAGKLDENISKAVEIALSDSYKESMLTFNSEIVEIQQDVVQKLAYGKLTVDEAVDELIQRFNRKLSELKK